MLEPKLSGVTLFSLLKHSFQSHRIQIVWRSCFLFFFHSGSQAFKSLRGKYIYTLLFFFPAVNIHTQSPSLPPTPNSVPPNLNSGFFSFSSNVIQAVKQKSAFNPVMRPPGSQGTSESTTGSAPNSPAVMQGE